MTDDIVDRLWLVRQSISREAGHVGEWSPHDIACANTAYDAAEEIKTLRRERGRLREALDRLERCIKFKQPDGSVRKITNWYSAALALQDIREELKGETE